MNFISKTKILVKNENISVKLKQTLLIYNKDLKKWKDKWKMNN